MSVLPVTSADETRLHCVSEGEGPTVVLLHGFPETGRSWDAVAPLLLEQGLRVVVPDLRGTGRSDRPAGVLSYHTDRLIEDIVAVIAAAGGGPVTLVGHDWGGIIAWYVAMRHPELVGRLVILNAPHPAWTTRLRSMPRQWLRSWYIAFFQIPWLPEAIGRIAGRLMLRRLLTHAAPQAFTHEQLEDYTRLADSPGPWLGYYRAWIRSRPWRATYRVVTAPTLVLWGDFDPHLGQEISGPEPLWAPDCVVEHTNSGHWLQNEQPEWVAARIASFARSIPADQKD